MKLEVEVLYNYTGVGISVNVNLCIAAPGLDITTLARLVHGHFS